jgi:hypothetical protein
MEYEFLTKGLTKVEGHLIPTDRTVEVFKEIYDIVEPKSIFEIGFNAGHSAFMALEMLPEVKYRSVDICRHAYSMPNGVMLHETYGDRFVLQKADSKRIEYTSLKEFDLIFIDGDHSIKGLTSDITLANNAEIPYMLIDDYHSKWFQSIIDLVDHFLAKEEFPYEKVDVFAYDSRDGDNSAILLKRIT